MSQPSRGVHMSTDGLTGWGEAARRVGEGVSAALMGSAAILQERAKVAAAGELAEFSERLKEIDRETREELVGQDVQDWNYAWQRTSAPKLAEALDELSPASRTAGRQLAEVYTARASLEAQRDHELQKIDKARAQWSNRVEDAIEAGDKQQAQEWLDAGQGMFIAPHAMPSRKEEIESRANLKRWQNDLQANPLQSLSRLSAASKEELPLHKSDSEMLTHAQGQARRMARREVLSNLLNCMDNEVSPEPEYIKLAAAAGVLDAQQAENVLKPAEKLSHQMRRDWLKRIDECAEDEVDDLQLEIATAPIPAKEKRHLLGRIEDGRRLPVVERRKLSSKLWDLYTNGALGCPGDEEAQQRFAALQQHSMARLESDGAQGAAEWVHGMRSLAERWVCFAPNTTV